MQVKKFVIKIKLTFSIKSKLCIVYVNVNSSQVNNKVIINDALLS